MPLLRRRLLPAGGDGVICVVSIQDDKDHSAQDVADALARGGLHAWVYKHEDQSTESWTHAIAQTGKYELGVSR